MSHTARTVKHALQRTQMVSNYTGGSRWCEEMARQLNACAEVVPPALADAPTTQAPVGPSERAVSKAKEFALPYGGHKIDFMVVDELAQEAVAAPEDVGLTTLEVIWALDHDWFVNCKSLSCPGPFSRFSVSVVEFSTDEGGTHHAKDLTFTDFAALRAWGGY